MRKKLPDFDNPDVWKNLKRECYDGIIDYMDFPSAEYKYFDNLRMCYLEFKFAGKSKAECEAKERMLYSEYKETKERIRKSLEMYQTYQNNIQTLSALRGEINKETDISEIARKAVNCVEILTNNGGMMSKILERKIK